MLNYLKKKEILICTCLKRSAHDLERPHGRINYVLYRHLTVFPHNASGFPPHAESVPTCITPNLSHAGVLTQVILV